MVHSKTPFPNYNRRRRRHLNCQLSTVNCQLYLYSSKSAAKSFCTGGRSREQRPPLGKGGVGLLRLTFCMQHFVSRRERIDPFRGKHKCLPYILIIGAADTSIVNCPFRSATVRNPFARRADLCRRWQSARSGAAPHWSRWGTAPNTDGSAGSASRPKRPYSCGRGR